MENTDNRGSVYSLKGPSFRNASCGYKNLHSLYPNYDSVKEFTRDIQSFIDEGYISQAKELYTQIRLKSKDPKDILSSLNQDGIKYVEIRTLDINPFYKCGLIKNDMKFLHLFLIFLLIKEESDYADWQEEARYNEEITAESAYDPDMKLLWEGSKVTLKDWGLLIIDEMESTLNELGIEENELLDLMRQRIIDSTLTYGKRLMNLIEEKGYINSQIALSKYNKLESQYLMESLKNMFLLPFKAVGDNCK